MSSTDSTFSHYEIVCLKRDSTFFEDVGGLTGVVVGVFQAEDDDSWATA